MASGKKPGPGAPGTFPERKKTLFHPHPPVWRRKGFRAEPAAQPPQPAAQPPPAPPAVVAGNQGQVAIELAFIGFIFVVLFQFIGFFGILIGIIAALLGLRVALVAKSTQGYTYILKIAIAFNLIVLGAIVLVIFNPGPCPGQGPDCQGTSTTTAGPGSFRSCIASIGGGNPPSCDDGPGGDGTPKDTLLNGHDIGICSVVGNTGCIS